MNSNKTVLFLFFILFLPYYSTKGQNNKVTYAEEVPNNCINTRDFCISENQDEIYFTIQSIDEKVSKIAYCTKTENQWSEVKLAPFSSSFRDIEPFLSPDGLRLYFSSNRPLKNEDNKSKDYDIWYVERKQKNSPWSEPINIGTIINSKFNEFYPSISKKKNLYFTSDRPTSIGNDDLYVSKWENNNYLPPENLGKNINSEGFEFNAYIEPDEKFILYTAYKRPNGFGSGDIYISYKEKDNQWMPSTNLGNEVNSIEMDYCPFYDVPTKTLYFTSKRNAIDSKKINSYKEFISEINKIENGQSKIYKIKISL